MANTHATLTSLFAAIADKIRKKTGSTATIVADDFPDIIDGILTPGDGTIATKTSSDLTASGATVTVPAGYYASEATKTVSAVTRASTTMSVSTNDTNDTMTITASNNQGTGYVTGVNETASKTISLTNSGSTVTASDGTNSISRSVATATLATPGISVSSNGLITASVTQSSGGYISANSTKSNTYQLTTHAGGTYGPETSGTIVTGGTYVVNNINLTGGSMIVDRYASAEVDSDYIYVYPSNVMGSTFSFTLTFIDNGSSSLYRMLTISSYNTSRCTWQLATTDPMGSAYMSFNSGLEYFDVYEDGAGGNYFCIPNPVGDTKIENTICYLSYMLG